jgi:hypothetical protein
MKLQKHYSGDNSGIFWKRISETKNEESHDELYSLGVILQNLEEFILKKLEATE